MKKAILFLSVFISLSAFSQKDYKIVGKDTVRFMDLGKIDEPQMFKLYQALQASKIGMSQSRQLSAFDVTSVYIPFIDSVSAVLAEQSVKWHPAPPLPPKIEAPKHDSTSAKK